MAPAVVAHPEARTKGVDPMATASVARSGRGGKRKCTSNQGRFMSLQADYRAGRLTDAGEERFERIVLEVGRLYRGR